MHGDLAAAARVVQGVVDQVAQRLAHQQFIGLNPHRRFSDPGDIVVAVLLHAQVDVQAQRTWQRI